MKPASEAYIIDIPVIVKARTGGDPTKRIVEVEASSEEVDGEGDVVLQKALLDSSEAFIRSGHIDIDHISEIGGRIGIRNPESYIIGRPTEVKDLGSKRTSVICEIMRASDGSHDPVKNKYDAFWDSLQSEPPVKWSASIYGFPTEFDDCAEKACSVEGATRYVIKAINWRSLAFTRNPVNTSLKGFAKIVTAKAMIETMKDFMSPFGLSEGVPTTDFMASSPMPTDLCCGGPCPSTMDALWGNYMRHSRDCPHISQGNSTVTFKDHFMLCHGAPHELADMLSHALLYMILRERSRSARDR